MYMFIPMHVRYVSDQYSHNNINAIRNYLILVLIYTKKIQLVYVCRYVCILMLNY